MHPAYMQPYAQQYVPAPGGYATGAMEIVGQFGPPVPAPPHPMAPMGGPHAGPVLLAHPHHPAHGWRGHPGGHGMVFAGFPGGGVAYGGAPAVVERPLRDIREYPLGFFQSGIGVCTGAIDVVSRPQLVFRGERLVIPSGLVASSFSLIDVKVGNRSQLANSTAVPAQTFTEVAVGVRLALDTAVVAMDIALVVENITCDNQTFQAALIGTTAQ
jgi:hypothetical protein